MAGRPRGMKQRPPILESRKEPAGVYNPSQEEIAEGLAAIRAEWNEDTELTRRTGPTNSRIGARTIREVHNTSFSRGMRASLSIPCSPLSALEEAASLTRDYGEGLSWKDALAAKRAREGLPPIVKPAPTDDDE